MHLPTFAHGLAAFAITAIPFSAHAQSYGPVAQVSEEARNAIAAGETYASVSDWRLLPSPDGCFVRKHFERDSDRVTLYIRQLQPDFPLQFFLFGTDFSEHRELEAGVIPSNGLSPIERIAETTIGNDVGVTFAGQLFPWIVGDPAPELPALAAQTSHYIVQGQGKEPVVLEIGAITPALQYLEGCAIENLTRLGVDVYARGSFTRRATLTNTQEVTRELIQEYTGMLRRTGAQGAINIRVIVDGDGSPIQCNAGDEITALLLREAACDIMIRSGEFEAAINADGQPAADIYQTRIIFERERWENADGSDLAEPRRR